MATPTFDLADIKRRMQASVQAFRHDLGGLRSGRASATLLEPVNVDAYGSPTPMAQVATISAPEPRMLTVQVWDRSLVSAVERAIHESNLGLSPNTEGQTIRLRLPEMTEQRRKELVKVAHKYAEDARVAVRHVRRDGLEVLKKLDKEGAVSADDVARDSEQVQKATDQTISEIDATLAAKEKEIMQV